MNFAASGSVAGRETCHMYRQLALAPHAAYETTLHSLAIWMTVIIAAEVLASDNFALLCRTSWQNGQVPDMEQLGDQSEEGQTCDPEAEAVAWINSFC